MPSGRLPGAGGDIASVYGNYTSRCFFRQREAEESLRHIGVIDFLLQKVVPEIIIGGKPSRLGPFFQHILGEQGRANAVGIDSIGADAVRPVIQRVLFGERHYCRLGKRIGTKIFSRIERCFGCVEQQNASRFCIRNLFRASEANI